VLLYNCVLRNIWQRGVKASDVPADKPDLHPRGCRIQFCLFINDRPKREQDDPDDRFGGNYIGGIDAKHTVGWTISDNVFVGLNGRTGEGRGAIYLSEEARDAVVERNVMVDCDVGIALGNPSLGGDWLHCIGCVVRNNVVVRCGETGILACVTKDCSVLHNTIHDPKSRMRRLIWVQQFNDGLVVANNLLSGPPIVVTTASKVRLENNVTAPDLSAIFTDPAAGDLRLKSRDARVTDVCERLPLVSHDLEHQPRLDRPDAGADELPR